MMKTILIDVKKGTAEVIEIEDDLDEFYKVLDCRCIDIVNRRIGRKRFDVMCDDEGLLKGAPRISAIDNLGHPMLVGNLMFFNSNDEGELLGLSDIDIKYIMDRIQLMSTHRYPYGYMMLTQCEY